MGKRSGFIVRVDKSSGDEIVNWFHKLKEEGAGMQVPLEQALVVMVRSVDKTFRAGGRPTWQAISKATKRLRARAGKDPDGPVLQVDGILRSSFVPGKVAESWRKITAKLAAFGSKVPYIAPHQLGADIRMFGKHIARLPKRELVRFHPEDIKAIADIFKKHYIRLAKTAKREASKKGAWQ
jgi:phage gpG-like protein